MLTLEILSNFDNFLTFCILVKPQKRQKQTLPPHLKYAATLPCDFDAEAGQHRKRSRDSPLAANKCAKSEAACKTDFLFSATSRVTVYTGCAKKMSKLFCQNFVKSPQNLIIVGTQIAKTIELCKVRSISISRHLCQRMHYMLVKVRFKALKTNSHKTLKSLAT